MAGVEHTPCNPEEVGSNPAGAGLLPTFLHQWSVPNKVPQGGVSLNASCGRKNACLAVLPEAKQAQKVQIG